MFRFDFGVGTNGAKRGIRYGTPKARRGKTAAILVTQNGRHRGRGSAEADGCVRTCGTRTRQQGKRKTTGEQEKTERQRSLAFATLSVTQTNVWNSSPLAFFAVTATARTPEIEQHPKAANKRQRNQSKPIRHAHDTNGGPDKQLSHGPTAFPPTRPNIHTRLRLSLAYFRKKHYFRARGQSFSYIARSSPPLLPARAYWITRWSRPLSPFPSGSQNHTTNIDEGQLFM